MAGFNVVPEDIQQAGQQAVTLAQDISNIVSSCSALIEAAGSGNMGFMTVPALAALTVAQFGAIANLGSQMDEHGRMLHAAAQSYQATDQHVATASNQNQQAFDAVGANAAALVKVLEQDLAVLRDIATGGTGAGSGASIPWTGSDRSETGPSGTTAV
ncbi:MAG: hypothetical protein HY241_07605 [Actinobacteria bacterium]|nr:hypothetical protein [Actinomycetota bacterium]